MLPTGNVVYFVQAPVNGLIKIGTTMGLRDRLLGLRSMCPVELRLVGFTPGDRALEGDLHAAFDDLRVHGEWFLPEPELIDAIGEGELRSEDRLYWPRIAFARLGGRRPFDILKARRNTDRALHVVADELPQRALLGAGGFYQTRRANQPDSGGAR